MAAGLLFVAVLAPASPARADTAYRYWAFYLGHNGSWQFSQRGPASEYPVDGEVEGWRFAVQAEAAHDLPPRAAPDFATLCAATPAVANEIRIGIVLDFGVAADEPAHEHPPASVVPGCVRVHPGDSGAAVLEAAAQVRLGTGADAGLVCGLDGYPASECAPAVTAPAVSTPSTAATPTAARPVPAAAAATTTAAAATTPAAAASTPAAPLPADSSVEPSTGSTAPTAPTALTAAAATGSAAAVDSLAPAAAGPTTLAQARAATPRGRGFSITTAIGIALVLALAIGALRRSRGRRR